MSPNLITQTSPRRCPVCDSIGARKVLHQQKFSEGPLGSGYDVAVCILCGAGFADGIPSQKDLDCYYAERSKYTYAHNDGAESTFDHSRFERIADQVEAHLPDKAARILDIGCATGGLLAALKKRGYRNIAGSDPAPACAAAARRIHGVEVRTASLREHEKWSERFDAILLVGVLEHLRDVGPLVDIAAKLLKPGAFLYCAQPDVESFAECENAPYQQFSIEHVNFFSATSLTRIMAITGLACSEIWHWRVEWREGVLDSVLSGVFRRTGGRASSRVDSFPTELLDSPFVQPSTSCGPPEMYPLEFDRLTGPSLERYIILCREKDGPLREMLKALAQSREPVLIWGAGTLARRLLATEALGDVRIVAFVDGNPHTRHQKLAGRPILAPSDIVGRPEAILICSKPFEREIIALVRKQLKLPNRLILVP